MHIPSPQSTAQVMTAVKAAYDLGHKPEKATKNPAISDGAMQIYGYSDVITTRTCAASDIVQDIEC